MVKTKIGAAATLLAVLAGCATAVVEPPPTDLPEVRPGYMPGYLKPQLYPDTKAFLPPPPAEGSAAFAADQEFYRVASKLKDTPRWFLAVRDADGNSPRSVEAFSCALDMPISAQETPHLNMLLRRVRMDASRVNDVAKEHYKRQRPFAVMGESSCTPDEEKRFRAEARSYPSGHASWGWAWALTLAEIAPERTDALLARGYAYGMSRVVCRAHWKTDVEAGRVAGAAAVARLHTDPVYLAQLAEARKEIQAARAAGRKSPLDCAAEQKALALGP